MCYSCAKLPSIERKEFAAELPRWWDFSSFTHFMIPADSIDYISVAAHRRDGALNTHVRSFGSTNRANQGSVSAHSKLEHRSANSDRVVCAAARTDVQAERAGGKLHRSIRRIWFDEWEPYERQHVLDRLALLCTTAPPPQSAAQDELATLLGAMQVCRHVLAT
jgi:hypothetical protein